MQQSGKDAMQQSGTSAVQCVCLDNTRPDPESEEAEKWLSGVRTGKEVGGRESGSGWDTGNGPDRPRLRYSQSFGGGAGRPFKPLGCETTLRCMNAYRTLR
jgi:hypothetical protein